MIHPCTVHSEYSGFLFQAADGIRDRNVTGVQTCALPISLAVYAAVNRFRLDDLHPHIFRTKDGGRTWTDVVEGIPSNEVVNAVREDPVRRGLLYAGTERGVYVSFDAGDHWQSLQLDLPASSVRDLVVHDSDLVVATHGRSFWVLDDITPLRQIAAAAAATAAYLYRPAPAVRV